MRTNSLQFPIGGAFAPAPAAAQPGLIHQAILCAVWLTLAASGVVFSEPAPVDVLMMGLIVLLPAAGLLHVPGRLAVYLAVWSIAASGGLIASTVSDAMGASTVFTLVSIYLYLASFTIAAFVAHTPGRHARLLFGAWLVAGVVAAAAGLVGYFGLIPGAYDLFTRFGRASGTFKDPNVMGAFLVAPFLYALHVALQSDGRSAVWKLPLSLMAAGVLALAVLLTFSRGAWINLAFGLVFYAVAAFVTADGARERQRILLAVGIGAGIVVSVMLALMADERIAATFADRASLTQSYDVGPAGRFGGQQKAFDLLLFNPLGIGAGQFVMNHHYEDVHNVYLSVFLNAGWLGGFTFASLVVITIGLGLVGLRERTAHRPLLVVAWAAFVATALEGVVIDIDHWRSFYILMGIIWGLSLLPGDVRASEDGEA